MLGPLTLPTDGTIPLSPDYLIPSQTVPEIIAAADVGLHELKISRLETQLVRAYAEIDTLRKERDQLRASKSRVRDAAGRLLKERDEAVRERNLFEARLTTLDLIG